MKKFDKHFGKIISLIIFLSILVLNNLQISNNNLNINNTSLLALVVLFFLLLYFFYDKLTLIFKILFLVLVYVIESSFISKFTQMIKEENINSSLNDKNAAISLSWIIIIPILFFLSVILGILFDYLKNLKK